MRGLKKFLRYSLIILLLLAISIFIFSRLTSPVTKYTDDYVYELPFAPGESYKVVQGYGGWFSHKNIAALDFAMPVGTPVHAAREGTIFSFQDQHDEGGPFPRYRRKANYIMIRHADGSIGCYWHLKKGGVVVKSGPVAKGQLIGYSGATGFVLRPHLHFSVKRKLNYEKDSFVKTRFMTDNGVTVPERGERYRNPVNPIK